MVLLSERSGVGMDSKSVVCDWLGLAHGYTGNLYE